MQLAELFPDDAVVTAGGVVAAKSRAVDDGRVLHRQRAHLRHLGRLDEAAVDRESALVNSPRQRRADSIARAISAYSNTYGARLARHPGETIFKGLVPELRHVRRRRARSQR